MTCKTCDKTCRKCKTPNHFATVCKYSELMSKALLNEQMNDLCEETYAMGLYHISTNTVKPYVCTVSMAGIDIAMEVETGASVSEKEWTRIKELAAQLTLNTNKAPPLPTYTGNTIQPLGQIWLR